MSLVSVAAHAVVSGYSLSTSIGVVPSPKPCVTHLGKVHAESVHVHAIQEACKALGETRQTLMHQLQLQEVLLQVRHCVAELREAIL
jgi:hypothetical protein